MTPTAALLVLNPRQIPDCIAAIRNLDIPTCWISNMPEPEAAKAINQQIRETDYDRYIVVADDTLPTQAALDEILRLMAYGHPVVTGYCNLDENDNVDIVNLTTNRLPPPPPQAHSYSFLTRQQVQDSTAGRAIPTTFAGLALTAATRKVWLEHPLEVSAHGGQMDYMLSYNLAHTSTPIVAAQHGYVHHVKERWNHTDRNPQKRLLVGVEPPAVTWTNVPAPA
jgi:hypothetical protein